MKKVRKAVIPAAGFGTRFLPQTKAMPKEMLPIVDKPVIQVIVEELVEAGITDIIIVTGYHKRSVEDHFDNPHQDLVKLLKDGGKEPLLDELDKLSKMANFYFARQKGIRKGNIMPLMNVQDLIGDEPVLYVWADDLFDTGEYPSATKQIISAYEKYDATILPCIRAKQDKDYTLYGFAGGKTLENGDIAVSEFIEKPGKENSPSDLAAVDGQLYTPEIFGAMNTAYERFLKESPENTEFGYYHVLQEMIKNGSKIIATEIKNGVYIDTGDVLKFLQTQVYFGVKHKKIGEDFKNYLKDFVKTI